MNRREALGIIGAITFSACARPAAAPAPSERPREQKTPSEKTPQSTPIPDRAPEGWTRFRSINYPYQLDYPQNWTAQSGQLLGKKVDVFKGEVIDDFQVNVNVLSEPINSWVTVEDYVQNYLAQVEQVAVYGKRSVGILNNEFKGVDESQLDYGNKIYYNLTKTDVAKNKTYIVLAFLKHPFGLDQKVTTLTAIFVANGKGWQITFSSSTKTGNERAPLRSLEKFQKMLASFKFIK